MLLLVNMRRVRLYYNAPSVHASSFTLVVTNSGTQANEGDFDLE